MMTINDFIEDLLYSKDLSFSGQAKHKERLNLSSLERRERGEMNCARKREDVM